MRTDLARQSSVRSSVPLEGLVHGFQEDLNLFEASEDADEEFYAGGGQYRRHGLEHFPQLWCQNGSYSVYGQVGASAPIEGLY